MPPRVKQLLLALIMSVVFMVTLSSCGKIGDPIPPGIVIPQTVTDQSARGEKQGDCSNYCSDESNVAEKYLQEKD
jgi:hypothetical protein